LNKHLEQVFWTFDRAVADEPFKREEVTVEQGVGPGPHLYVVGPNRIHLINPDSLKYQGQISTGTYGQFVLSDPGDTVFVASTYYSRGWTGTRTDVVQIYDSTTLQQKAEVAIPTRKAMISAKRPLMALSSDSHWVLVQNADAVWESPHEYLRSSRPVRSAREIQWPITQRAPNLLEIVGEVGVGVLGQVGTLTQLLLTPFDGGDGE
jgi:hypothetical protein